MKLDFIKYNKFKNFLKDATHPRFNFPLALRIEQVQLLKYLLSRSIIYYKHENRNCGISTLLQYFTIWNLVFNSKDILFCHSEYNRCCSNADIIAGLVRSLFGISISENLMNKRAWANIKISQNNLINTTNVMDSRLTIDKKNTILIIDDDKKFKAINVCLKLNPVLNEFYMSIVIEPQT